MRNAIKLIAIHKILGQSILLESIPDVFKHVFFQPSSGPQRYSEQNQSPLLVNLQIKVGLYRLQYLLLSQVLQGFRRLLLLPDAWTSCLFISMCLAFLLERIETASRGFLELAKDANEHEPITTTDATEYCDGVDGILFSCIYRQMSIKISSRSVDSNAMGAQLLEAVARLKTHFGKSTQIFSFFVIINSL